MLLALASPATAGARPPTAIPAGALEDTLNRLAAGQRQAILFDPGLVKGLRAPPLAGDGDLDQILARLLGPHGLAFKRVGDAVLIVKATPVRIEGAEAPPPLALEPVVVSALGRSSLRASTPLAITVLQGETLRTLRTLTLDDLAAQAPGLAFSRSGIGPQSRISLRGMVASGEPTVGAYLDETPITGPSGSTADAGSMIPQLALFDIDRIEVLRGPQGTLYGSGSLSGTVRALFNQPDFQTTSLEATISASATQGGAPGGRLMVVGNQPMLDGRGAVRLVAFAVTEGGYVDAPRLNATNLNDRRQVGGRLSARLRPTDHAELSLSAVWQEEHDGDSGLGSGQRAAYQTDESARTPYDDTFAFYSAKLTLEGPVTFHGSAAHYRWAPKRRLDTTWLQRAQAGSASACAMFAGLDTGTCDSAQTAAFVTYVGEHTPSFFEQPLVVQADIQEARLSGAGARGSWLLGAYHELRRDGGSSRTFTASAADGRSIGQSLGWRAFDSRMSQTAVFGEGVIDLTSQISLTLGARRYAYDKSASSEVLEANPILAMAVSPRIARRTQDTGWSRKMVVAFRPGTKVMTYAQVSEGFRPGGVNATASLAGHPATYEADRTTSYEIGAKTHLRPDLEIDLAAYRADWRNVQFSSVGSVAGFFDILNIGAARVDGLEADLIARPASGLDIKASASMLNARLVESTRSDIAAGSQMPLSPRFMLGAMVEYGRPIGADARWTSNLALTYRSHVHARFDHTSASDVRAGDALMVDLGLGLERPAWRVHLAASNILNGGKRLAARTDAFGIDQIVSARPRTISIEFGRHF